MTLYVLTPSRQIAEAALRVDHGIDPRSPVIRFVGDAEHLRGLPYGAPVWLLDPLGRADRRMANIYRHLAQTGRLRAWSEAERASVRAAR